MSELGCRDGGKDPEIEGDNEGFTEGARVGGLVGRKEEVGLREVDGLGVGAKVDLIALEVGFKDGCSVAIGEKEGGSSTTGELEGVGKEDKAMQALIW